MQLWLYCTPLNMFSKMQLLSLSLNCNLVTVLGSAGGTCNCYIANYATCGTPSHKLTLPRSLRGAMHGAAPWMLHNNFAEAYKLNYDCGHSSSYLVRWWRSQRQWALKNSCFMLLDWFGWLCYALAQTPPCTTADPIPYTKPKLSVPKTGSVPVSGTTGA